MPIASQEYRERLARYTTDLESLTVLGAKPWQQVVELVILESAV
jgi:hypothetical protein